MAYTPILDSLQQLFSNPKISEIITSQPPHSNNEIFYDVYDGQCFKNNPIFPEHSDALQIILYHDELKIYNPYGSQVGKCKMDLYY